jgi:hypothetical protein
MTWFGILLWAIFIVAFIVGWIRTARLRRHDRPLFPTIQKNR